MNKKILIGIVLVAIVFSGIILFKNYLPPRTPINVARIHSGLKIPQSSSVIDFKEDYAFTGEGQIIVKLKLNDLDIENIKKQCIDLEYKKLTIENLVKDEFLNSDPQLGFNMPNTDLRNIKNGYYKLNATDLEQLDFTMTVLDMDKNELSIWTIIP